MEPTKNEDPEQKAHLRKIELRKCYGNQLTFSNDFDAKRSFEHLQKMHWGFISL